MTLNLYKTILSDFKKFFRYMSIIFTIVIALTSFIGEVNKNFIHGMLRYLFINRGIITGFPSASY